MLFVMLVHPSLYNTPRSEHFRLRRHWIGRVRSANQGTEHQRWNQ